MSRWAPYALVEISQSFVRCSSSPPALLSESGSSATAVEWVLRTAPSTPASWEPLGTGREVRRRGLASLTRCQILGSVVSGDTTFVVYRLSHPMAPKHPFPDVLSIRKIDAGYALIPFLSPEDALMELGLPCGEQ